jgi:hypothetical protein
VNSPTTANQTLLRMALLGNVGFSIVSAAVAMFWKEVVMHWLDISKDFGILFLGVGLMIFAIWLLINGVRTNIKLQDARIAVAIDLAWVALSVPVVVFAPLSSQGKWVVTVVAAIVLSFAVTQWMGIQRINRVSQ